MEQTKLSWIEETKSVTLQCSDKLWDYLQSIRNKNMKDLDLVTLAKIYKEIKSLDIKLEKEN